VPLSLLLCTTGFSEAVRAGFCPHTHVQLRPRRSADSWQRVVEARGMMAERASVNLLPLPEPLLREAAAWGGHRRGRLAPLQWDALQSPDSAGAPALTHAGHPRP
jgi:hypothetical protein